VRCPWHGACFSIKSGDIEDFPGLDSIPKFDVCCYHNCCLITHSVFLGCHLSINRPDLFLSVQPKWQLRTCLFNYYSVLFFNDFAFISNSDTNSM